MGQTASKGLSKVVTTTTKTTTSSINVKNVLTNKPLTDFKPPLPVRRPPLQSTTTTSSSVDDDERGSTNDKHQQQEVGGGGGLVPDAANPGNFLRGGGIATQDVRDIGQEMYLQNVQQQQHQRQRRDDGEKSSSSITTSSTSSTSSSSTTSAVGMEDNNYQNSSSSSSSSSNNNNNLSNKYTNIDMPPDLLRFIQQVGPVKQSIDTDYTAPRLLQQENVTELNIVESQRRPSTRKRVRMPLMGDDTTYTTEKNTYFKATTTSGSTSQQQQQQQMVDFGITNLQLYGLLSRGKKGTGGDNSEDTSSASSSSSSYNVIVDDFYQNIMTMATAASTTTTTSSSSSSSSSSFKVDERTMKDSIKKHKGWLLQTLNVLDLPTLRMDSDGNILGLYPKDVVVPPVVSDTDDDDVMMSSGVRTIPESKVMLVLADLASTKDNNNIIGMDGTTGTGDAGNTDAGMASEHLRQRRKERLAAAKAAAGGDDMK